VTNFISRWRTPLVGFGVAVILAAVELAQGAPLPAAIAILAIVGGYSLVLARLRTRSDTASLLTGAPVDERWELINQRALAAVAEVMAVVLVGAYIVSMAAGVDPLPYFWTTTVLGFAYLAAIAWFRWRS
jgi:hypothetical protein